MFDLMTLFAAWIIQAILIMNTVHEFMAHQSNCNFILYFTKYQLNNIMILTPNT